MKKVFVFYLAFTYLFISCKEDFVCSEGTDCPENISQQNNEPLTFTDDNGSTFSTGLNCENPSPNYNVNQNILLENLVIPDDLPAEFDLGSMVPPVGDQGIQGSCVSWAVTYYMKSIQEKVQFNHNYNTTTLMSPAYTYNQLAKGKCGGTYIDETLDILKEQGTTSLETFPYVENDCLTLPDNEEINLASINKISDYKNLSGENMVNEMKTLLSQFQPIIISVIIDGNFGLKDPSGLFAYREHKIDYKLAKCHAVTVVGYSNVNKAFKAVNSWGSSWGDGGYIWIDYKAFENVLKPDEEFRVIRSAHVAFDAN